MSQVCKGLFGAFYCSFCVILLGFMLQVCPKNAFLLDFAFPLRAKTKKRERNCSPPRYSSSRNLLALAVNFIRNGQFLATASTTCS